MLSVAPWHNDRSVVLGRVIHIGLLKFRFRLSRNTILSKKLSLPDDTIMLILRLSVRIAENYFQGDWTQFFSAEDIKYPSSVSKNSRIRGGELSSTHFNFPQTIEELSIKTV
jgi:hypothetical protein